MSTLERAIAIAVQAHYGQKDRSGAPYILHPLRVMFRLRSEEQRIVAILHDVVEDSDWTLDRLRAEGFPAAVVQAIDCVTRRPEESYEAFVERSKSDPLARAVKLADLDDNLDLSRLPEITEQDLARLNRYKRAKLALQGEWD